MRVISGRFGGRRLAPVISDLRPTADRLRESLFNVLHDRVSGSRWLDLFAGSGAVGIEAISRGARWVTFNDRDPRAVELTRTNLEICGIRDGFEVVNQDAFRLVTRLRPSEELDFIFLDPPYDFGRYRKLLEKIVGSSLLSKKTWIILEVFKKTPVEVIPEGLSHLRSLRAGDSLQWFLQQAT